MRLGKNMQLVFTNTFFEIILLVNGLAILLYYASRKKKKQRAMMFGNYETLQKVAGEKFLKKNDILLLLQLLALTSFFLAVSEPSLEKTVPGTESDFVITIDSSATMTRQDYDSSRLGAAKKASKDFVNSLPNSTQIGVISYSGKIDSRKGLSSNKKKVIDEIDEISLGEEAGTATGNALITSSTMLINSSKNRKVILLSDGRNNVGSSINESIEFANNQNITINSIGFAVNESGERFERLKTVAERTGGNFTKVDKRDSIGKTLISQQERTSRDSLTTHFILLGVLLLLIQWSLGTTRYDILP